MTTEIEFFRESFDMGKVGRSTLVLRRGRPQMNSTPQAVPDSIEKSYEYNSNEGDFTGKSEESSFEGPIAELEPTYLKLISKVEMSPVESTEIFEI
eukprot:CAMPEP_0185792892 /NCGR_PEP_ID=MMETSP1174-20130828/159177_1 /TAXON_ID=35687 /ORGANISM="Dictyocha speculum, Strain CCMP1381" /LENGTH=95 /DNA_ID=CAMNT_0028487991 /DNA_START=2355 /DNA_END=2642 /DNA_ORIENTATION=+